ncbi:MAG TPA: ACT domain-containing protein [Halanaerobiaceae bacterium]|nr:ACT domain-containing protein [Bacillota bacterium]HHU92143.1 ACT domain-containing protein [Halanaerobiaceae bacterium]HOA39925.1 ACT domain-containing protein [Halanaerobiales bacterium]HPZ62000.1 ACT domain-containing protein [Halanaerobiales bacterium]HQD03277.1 ACT domain-containing protein [Halanaerobiales bacterium]
MTVKQLSVFLENKAGRLTELTRILGKAGINMTALSIADTSEFGIIRIVVSDPEKALQILKENNFSVNLTDVVCLTTANQAGALAEGLEVLSAEGISVEYMYAFSIGQQAFIILKTEDIYRTIEVLEKNNMHLLKATELYNI